MVSLDILHDPRGKINVKYVYGGLVLVSILLVHGLVRLFTVIRHIPVPSCPQPAKLVPSPHWLSPDYLLTSEYRSKSAKYLSGAVQIPTESFDDMHQDPTQERRFDVFHELHNYLNASFPLVSEHLEYVNTYGLLYTLEGRDTSKKPVVLMAHQDVVPVNPATAGQWTHEPFSGFVDDEFIWGRGSEDTKSTLVGILEAAELLLKNGWVPERTVLISFGFDEELDGSRGAHALAEEIKARYGHDSVHMIIDEGSPISNRDGTLFALPSVAEKGYTDIEVRIETPGGHSSVPPDHTGIGFMAKVIEALEAHESAFKPQLADGSVVASTFGCLAAYSEDLPAKQRGLYSGVGSAAGRRRLAKVLGDARSTRPMVQTTQAIDVIEGGVKVNALPETVTLLVNYRIDVDSSVAEVTTRLANIALKVAQKAGLGVVVNNATVTSGDQGTLFVTNGQSLEPAPIAPFTPEDDAWALLSGTTRYVTEDLLERGPVFMAPLLSTGNTDTVHYWDLTNRIYRYYPAVVVAGGAHTVDEFISIDSHVDVVVWYYIFLQALD